MPKCISLLTLCYSSPAKVEEHAMTCQLAGCQNNYIIFETCQLAEQLYPVCLLPVSSSQTQPMGQKAVKKREVERYKAAAAKKHPPNDTSTTTQSAHSSESSMITAATAASDMRQKKATVPKSSAQARSMTCSTRSLSCNASEVASLGNAVVVTSAPDRDDMVQGSDSKEGHPAHPKAAAAIQHLVEQVKTLDATEDSDTNSDNEIGRAHV